MRTRSYLEVCLKVFKMGVLSHPYKIAAVNFKRRIKCSWDYNLISRFDHVFSFLSFCISIKVFCFSLTQKNEAYQDYPLHKKRKFPLRISSVNVIKSAVSCRFGHIYWRNPSWKTSFYVQPVEKDRFLVFLKTS